MRFIVGASSTLLSTGTRSALYLDLDGGAPAVEEQVGRLFVGHQL